MFFFFFLVVAKSFDIMLKIIRYSYSIMIKYTQEHEEKLTLFSFKDLHLQQKATYLLLSFVWYYETIHW